MGMETSQIYGYLTSFLKDNLATFDVLPCDYLLELQIHRYPLCLVVNTGKSNTAGTHWAALFRENASSSIKFIDSFGMGLASYDPSFNDFAKSLNCEIVENVRTLLSLQIVLFLLSN